MKILMLGWELPPHNSGGLGVACFQLCKALAQKGADIEFILPYTAEHNIDFMNIHSVSPQGVKDIIKSGIAYDSYKYVYVDGTEEVIDIYGQQLSYELSVERLAEILEFDVIHAHDWLTFRAAMKAKILSGKPMIAHVHSLESDRAGGKSGNPYVHEIEYMGLMMADKIVAVSEFTKQTIISDYDIPADKIDVVHNSIDIDMVQPLSGENAYQYLAKMKANGYKVVTNVGRLTIQKGLTNLLRAAKEVVYRMPKTIFLLVGSGDQYYELITLTAELGITKNVIMTGFQRGKQWRDAFAVADLFVMPSVSEPFGIVPLEAISYGAPTLITKQSGVAEVLANTLKVDFWDISEMANQIVGALESDSLRQVLLANALSEYQGMSWDNSADKMMGLYQTHSAGVLT